jgi:hypothetical protein
MAFGPGTTTGADLTRKGSLKAQWPEAGALENLKGLDAETETQPVINADAAVFNLANSDGNLLRHNFAAAVQDGTLGANQVSVQLGSVADTVRATAEKEKEERRKQDENLRFIRTLQDIQDRLRGIEDGLAAKYGRNFAEELAKRYLEKEEAERLLKIEDEEERKHQIALAIKRRVDSGEIHAPELSSPEYKDWLDTHKEKERVLEAQAKEAIADVKAGKELNIAGEVEDQIRHTSSENELSKTFASSAINALDASNSKGQNLDDLFASSDSFQAKPNVKPFS